MPPGAWPGPAFRGGLRPDNGPAIGKPAQRMCYVRNAEPDKPDTPAGSV